MPWDTHKVRFTSEAVVYHLPTVNKAMPVPSLPKRPRKICRAHSNQQSLGEGTSIDLHATEPYFLPISQIVVQGELKPRKNKDFEATGHHAHPGELVIPAAPKTAENQAIRPLPQHMSAQIDIPSGPKKAHRISTTCQNLLMLLLPSEPKVPHSHLDSVQSMPGPSMTMVLDTLAMWISYQATPDPHKIDYKEGLYDLLKRAMEDHQWMFVAACKCHGCVLEWQKRLVVELEILQMEWKKYII
ncbi:hypothetical protein PAXRUDRAFT_152669 [Paxillus rubicundulus Ve08.2h10]|uniref:Uncharacterized protein n=1 Tax=Paxillus rubicundulus Ve08.2h10 TaxID=930991 RepID=A0A0D0DJ68_9AGAM|nr:hypothetical protein PAXRUDRAFT_152669 [Paxillus rubicundulus Ve08.2h10]